ncbi:multiple inositol polyphosphate phosphatase 1 [Amia ocellicauda]|uniref:multiple inositol polyphosphate phosphatase 1 n=1 Tax=Amia ocellicauda TaxID=2972642 RepID=UPI003463EEC7
MALTCKRSAVLVTLGLALARFCSACNTAVVGTSRRPDIPAIAEYFGTKARYEEVNPDLINNILTVHTSVAHLPYGDCTPVHVTAVIRHGTRYPTAKNVRKIRQLYELVLEKSRDSGEGWLQEIRSKWEMWYHDGMDGQLVEKGQFDHRNLAVRLATVFPTLLSKDNLLSDRLRFITSSKHRCVDSIGAFQEGLTALWQLNGTDIPPSSLPQHDDDLMRFFDHCKKFVEDVEKNKTALIEVDLFMSKSEMKRVQEKVADRLQILESDISPDLIEAAFHLCSYEFAIKKVNSPWCNLFDLEDAKVLEYRNDLKQYWKRGYGYEINRKSSCPLFHDLFRRLDRAENESRINGHVSEAATVQVGHAETLLPLLSLMGFFKDEMPLTSDNFALQQGRTFRTSRIVPYASNLLVVLHRCRDTHRVQLLLNEKPLTFPHMSDPAPEYDTVKDFYRDLLQGCDFKKECQLSTNSCKNSSGCGEL